MQKDTPLRVQVDALLEQWEKDRRGFPTSEDWRAQIADSTLKQCINELRCAVDRAAGTPLLQLAESN